MGDRAPAPPSESQSESPPGYPDHSGTAGPGRPPAAHASTDRAPPLAAGPAASRRRATLREKELVGLPTKAAGAATATAMSMRAQATPSHGQVNHRASPRASKLAGEGGSMGRGEGGAGREGGWVGGGERDGGTWGERRVRQQVRGKENVGRVSGRKEGRSVRVGGVA